LESLLEKERLMDEKLKEVLGKSQILTAVDVLPMDSQVMVADSKDDLSL